MDEVNPSEIRTFIADAKANAVQRRNGRGGRSAEENRIGVLRCLYRRATADGFLDEAQNPALKVAKPKRAIGDRD